LGASVHSTRRPPGTKSSGLMTKLLEKIAGGGEISFFGRTQCRGAPNNDKATGGKSTQKNTQGGKKKRRAPSASTTGCSRGARLEQRSKNLILSLEAGDHRQKSPDLIHKRRSEKLGDESKRGVKGPCKANEPKPRGGPDGRVVTSGYPRPGGTINEKIDRPDKQQPSKRDDKIRRWSPPKRMGQTNARIIGDGRKNWFKKRLGRG